MAIYFWLNVFKLLSDETDIFGKVYISELVIYLLNVHFYTTSLLHSKTNSNCKQDGNKVQQYLMPNLFTLSLSLLQIVF